MKRGRKSAAEVEMGSLVVDVSRQLPLPPPAELTDAQAAVWRDAAASMSGGNWLTRGAAPILVEYSRHVCRARLLERMISDFQPEWLKVDGGVERLDRLLAMAERETRAATACARALRLTPQSQIGPRTAGRRTDALPTGPRPWDAQ